MLLAYCILFAGCTPKPNNKEVAIAFYNCENFFDTNHNPAKEDEEFTPEGKYHYTQRIYEQKVHNIATVIQQMGVAETGNTPAIIGLAEVENNTVLNDLIHQPELARQNYKYEWYDGPDPRGINVALLYNPAFFTALRSEPLHVDLSSTGGKSITRDVLHVSGILNGDTVDVFVNHWPSRRGGEEASEVKRSVAADVDKRAMDKITVSNPNAKIIIMGDLNDNPTDSSIVNVLHAKGNKNEVGEGDMYNPWTDFYNSGTGTESFRHNWNLFDQVIISSSFLKNKNHKLTYSKAEIFKPSFIVDTYKGHEGEPHRSFVGTHWINGYSDHFPVIMYLTR